MTTYPAYSYSMGFQVNGTPIPDPAEWSGAISDLDSMGERDATGELHRDMVATKHPLKLAWNNISWDMVKHICQLVKGPEFQFTYDDPQDGVITIRAYAGDREWQDKFSPDDGIWIADLKFSVLEF